MLRAGHTRQAVPTSRASPLSRAKGPAASPAQPNVQGTRLSSHTAVTWSESAALCGLCFPTGLMKPRRREWGLLREGVGWETKHRRQEGGEV